jgi:hypothetical protein
LKRNYILLIGLIILLLASSIVNSEDMNNNIIDEIWKEQETQLKNKKTENKIKETLQNGDKTDVQILLANDLKINQIIDGYKNTPLNFSAQNEDIEVIKLIFEKRKVRHQKA